jgi:hypothetical protein
VWIAIAGFQVGGDDRTNGVVPRRNPLVTLSFVGIGEVAHRGGVLEIVIVEIINLFGPRSGFGATATTAFAGRSSFLIAGASRRPRGSFRTLNSVRTLRSFRPFHTLGFATRRRRRRGGSVEVFDIIELEVFDRASLTRRRSRSWRAFVATATAATATTPAGPPFRFTFLCRLRSAAGARWDRLLFQGLNIVEFRLLEVGCWRPCRRG